MTNEIPKVRMLFDQPDHQKGQKWASNPFGQLDKLANWCNENDCADSDRQVSEVIIELLNDYQKLILKLELKIAEK